MDDPTATTTANVEPEESAPPLFNNNEYGSPLNSDEPTKDEDTLATTTKPQQSPSNQEYPVDSNTTPAESSIAALCNLFDTFVIDESNLFRQRSIVVVTTTTTTTTDVDAASTTTSGAGAGAGAGASGGGQDSRGRTVSLTKEDLEALIFSDDFVSSNRYLLRSHSMSVDSTSVATAAVAATITTTIPENTPVSDFPETTVSIATTATEKTTKLDINKLATEHERNAGEWTVIAFINTASGGHMGEKVYHDLIKLLGGTNFVIDLSKCKRGSMPEDTLLPYAADPKVRVLACGGDGTMGWIESAIDIVWDRLLGPSVNIETTNYKGHFPLAIMPLGTGNDLSRTFGWGPKYSKAMSRPQMIQSIQDALPARLDRWRCVIIPDTALDEEAKHWVPDLLGSRTVDPMKESIVFGPNHGRNDDSNNNSNNSFKKNNSWFSRVLGLPKPPVAAVVAADDGGTSSLEEPPQPRVSHGIEMQHVLDGIFCNYLSIGFDAQVAFSFHKDRREHPERYTSVTGNKLKYAIQGLTNGTRAPRLRKRMRISVMPAATPKNPNNDDNNNNNNDGGSNSSCNNNNNNCGRLEELCIPRQCRAVALLNIQSYAGGNRLTNAGAYDDGLIDVVFMTTVWRLAVIGGMARLLPFARFQLAAQTSRVCIKLLRPLHCQVDGEPWLQGAATIHVRHVGRSAVLQRSAKSCPLNCKAGGS